jgi:hypothetical protein
MAQTEKSFLEILKAWKRKHWIIFASEKNKKFWCNLSAQYKVTLRSNLNASSKIIYIGDDIKNAYKVWLDN